MRRCHILKGNKGCEMPHEAVWMDTETKPVINEQGEQRHQLMFGDAAYRRTYDKDQWTQPAWARFETVPEFWDWIESLLHGKSRLYIFAHNWAFDAPVVDTFSQLPERGWTLTGSVIQSPPVILKWRRGPHTIMMVDTLNIWRMSLAKIGESINLPKLTMPDYGAPQDQWDTYAHRDVEIIMEACLQWWNFLKLNDLGGFAATLASQAFRTYRHRFMSEQILIDDNESALELSRRALHGGRTECFYIGKVKSRVYKWDVNSMYPAVMRVAAMPAKLIGHYRNVSYQELAKWVTQYCVVADCLIETNEPAYGVVHDDKLVFPVGRFVASLSTPEIEHAILNDHLVEVQRAAVYEPKVLFRDFVDWMYKFRLEQRAAGNEIAAWNTKILMNSLFGKFAQRGLIYDKIDDTDDLTIKVWSELDAETGTVYRLRQYGGIVEQLKEETEARDSHPAIAAHITAHVRLQLWRLIKTAGVEHVFYCDTDSVWCDALGSRRLAAYQHETDLGKLKLEGTHDTVMIHVPKDYVCDDVTRIKGIRKTAVEVEPGVYTQDKFSTLKGLLRRGDLSAPIVSPIRKRLRREYNKGVVLKSGRVVPLSLPLDGS